MTAIRFLDPIPADARSLAPHGMLIAHDSGVAPSRSAFYGDALTLVIIAKLPFASPGHPLVQARMALIKQQGRDPFAEHSLPEAILKFRQGFGRLIRSAQDRGKVVVLDPRVRTKGYGRKFLAALPFSPDHDPTG